MELFSSWDARRTRRPASLLLLFVPKRGHEDSLPRAVAVSPLRIDFVARAHRPQGKHKRFPRIFAELARQGHDVRHVDDGGWRPSRPRALMIGTVPFFPATFRRLRAAPRAQRPLSVLWQTESLPPPPASGLRPARRTAREWAEDRHARPARRRPALEPRGLAPAHADGLPDVLVMETRVARPFLAEHGHRRRRGSRSARPRRHAARPRPSSATSTSLFVGDAGRASPPPDPPPDAPRGRRCLAPRGSRSTGRVGDERTRLLNRTPHHAQPRGGIPASCPRCGSSRDGVPLAASLSEPIWDPRPVRAGRALRRGADRRARLRGRGAPRRRARDGRDRRRRPCASRSRDADELVDAVVRARRGHPRERRRAIPASGRPAAPRRDHGGGRRRPRPQRLAGVAPDALGGGVGAAVGVEALDVEAEGRARSQRWGSST